MNCTYYIFLDLYILYQLFMIIILKLINVRQTMAVVGVNDQWWVNWQNAWVLLSKIGLKLGYRLSSEVSWQHKNEIFLFCGERTTL